MRVDTVYPSLRCHYFEYRISGIRGRNEYFLTSCTSLTLAGSVGGGSGVELTSDCNVLPLLESALR